MAIVNLSFSVSMDYLFTDTPVGPLLVAVGTTAAFLVFSKFTRPYVDPTHKKMRDNRTDPGGVVTLDYKPIIDTREDEAGKFRNPTQKDPRGYELGTQRLNLDVHQDMKKTPATMWGSRQRLRGRYTSAVGPLPTY
jgi:hypothetical protein